MASLIFWGPILTHKAVISHRREKQRVKNYERWEGLRDDYDEQRRVARESRSLDIQRTGSWDNQQFSPTAAPQHPPLEESRSYVSLRDQQEANDARTGWRPQECWDGPKTQLQAQMTGQVQQYQRPHMPPQQHVSMTPTVVPQMTGTQSPTTLPLRSQKTGATWDEGLPAPLAVSRQSFDDYDHTQRYRSMNTQSMPVSREASLTRQQTSYFSPPPGQPQQTTTNMSRQNSVSRPTPNSNMSRQASISRTQTPSGLRESTTAAPLYSVPSAEMQVTQVVELPKNEFGFVDPARVVAGGRMAELIERGY